MTSLLPLLLSPTTHKLATIFQNNVYWPIKHSIRTLAHASKTRDWTSTFLSFGPTFSRLSSALPGPGVTAVGKLSITRFCLKWRMYANVRVQMIWTIQKPAALKLPDRTAGWSTVWKTARGLWNRLAEVFDTLLLGKIYIVAENTCGQTWSPAPAKARVAASPDRISFIHAQNMLVYIRRAQRRRWISYQFDDSPACLVV
jgi:hypothetical protein